MKRWHEEINITLREWRKHRKTHVESNIIRSQGEGPYQAKPGSDPYKVDCACDDQIGRFRKTDAFDCGIPHCKICHYNKYPKRELSRQEEESNRRFKEQLKELD